MGTRKRRFSRRRFILSAGVATTAAGLASSGPPALAAEAAPAARGGHAGAARPDVVQPDVTHFQSDGGISGAYLVNQLAGNGQSIGGLAFITSGSGGNLELLARGGAGTFVKLNYLDGGGTERTGLAVATGTDHPIISIAPEAGGGASLDLENNDLTGVETVVPSPDNDGQLSLDGLLALTPQAEPAVPASGGVLYVDTADGGLKFKGSAGTVTTLAHR